MARCARTFYQGGRNRTLEKLDLCQNIDKLLSLSALSANLKPLSLQFMLPAYLPLINHPSSRPGD